MRSECASSVPVRLSPGAAFAHFAAVQISFTTWWRGISLMLVLATAVSSAAVAQKGAPRLIAVSNERSHDITLIDGASLRVIGSIPLAGRARGIRLSPDHRSLLVALSDDRLQTAGPNDGIAVVDIATRKVTKTFPAGSDPEQFAITPDYRRIYAANEDAGTATVIDPATGKVLVSLAVGTEPEGVAVSPNGKWAYMTGETSNTISVIDVAKDKVVNTFLVDPRPRAVAFTADGRFAYATSEVGGSIARIDARKHIVLARERIGTGEEKPVGVVVSKDGKRVYLVTGAAHALVALDAVTLREIGRVPVGRRPWGIALSPDGTKAYTANGLTDDMSVVDLATLKVVATVHVGTRPWGVVVIP